MKKDPADWRKFLNEYDYPKTWETTSLCIIMTFTMVMFPSWLGKFIVNNIVSLYFDANAYDDAFAFGHYLPMITKAV